MPVMNMIQALNDAHKVMMRADEDIVVFGEDIGLSGRPTGRAATPGRMIRRWNYLPT